MSIGKALRKLEMEKKCHCVQEVISAGVLSALKESSRILGDPGNIAKNLTHCFIHSIWGQVKCTLWLSIAIRELKIKLNDNSHCPIFITH